MTIHQHDTDSCSFQDWGQFRNELKNSNSNKDMELEFNNYYRKLNLN